MKKLGFLVILTMVCCANAFAGECPSFTTEYEVGQDPDDNEFLYPSVNDWNTAYNRYNGAEGVEASDSVTAVIYECDDDFCTDGQRVIMNDKHYFKGAEQSGPTMYTCRINTFDDKWVSNELEECDDFSDNWEKLEFVNTSDHECYEKVREDEAFLYISYCCLSEGAKACFAAKKRGEPANWNGTSCDCGDVHTWDYKQKKCVPNAPNKDKPDPVINPPADKKTCREQRTTETGKACCDTLSLGTYKPATDKCECKSGLDFVIENGKGYCRPTQDDAHQTQYECDKNIMAQIAKWKTDCAKNTDIVALIAQIEEYCVGKNKTAETFMSYYNTLRELNPQNCAQTSNTDVTITITKLTERVNDAYSKLTSIHNKFRDEKSVWKDKDGNFNTARLASDSIAGVVLGTTGALVTSHVVKKNQVENGFEDIKCTIGGQNVAQWGDQFRVGIQ